MFGLLLLFIVAFLVLTVLGSAGVLVAILRPRRKTYAVAVALGCPTEPAELGLEGELATFNLPGGHTSPGWIIAGAAPDGPTVLILHGHRDSRYGALYRAKELHPYASSLVVFDWPSHGDCTAKWMTCGLREPGDVVAVLDGLPDALRKRPVVLFGYSLGGQIAIKTAAKYPRFAGVIADCPYRYWSSPIKLRAKRWGYPSLPFLPLVGLVFWLMGATRHFDRAAWAAKIDVPLMVIHGTADSICPFEEGRQIAQAAPLGVFVPIEGGRHIDLTTHAPEKYHAALVRLFERVASADTAPVVADTLAG